MQKLHLVGYTTDREGLIFSARRGSRSGGYLVEVDEELLAAVSEAGEAVAERVEAEAEAEAEAVAARRSSSLPIRDLQARLRSGQSVEEVAAAAGVDPEWVERFAAPVLAEAALVIERVKGARLVRPRLGASARPVGAAVLEQLRSRGTDLRADELGWSARQVAGGRWEVACEYRHRGRVHRPRFELELATGAVTALDKTGAQIAYVAPEVEAEAAGRTSGGEAAAPAGRSRAAEVPPAAQGDRRAGSGSARGRRRSPAARERERAAQEMERATARRKAEAARLAKQRTKERAAATKAAAKAAAAERAAAKKAAAAEKAAAKKVAAKKAAVKKAAVKKAAVKKAAVKKAAVKKAAVKKAAVKKAVAKKAAVKKAAVKKAVAKTKAAEHEAAPTRTADGSAPAASSVESVTVERELVDRAQVERPAESSPVESAPVERAQVGRAQVERVRVERAAGVGPAARVDPGPPANPAPARAALEEALRVIRPEDVGVLGHRIAEDGTISDPTPEPATPPRSPARARRATSAPTGSGLRPGQAPPPSPARAGRAGPDPTGDRQASPSATTPEAAPAAPRPQPAPPQPAADRAGGAASAPRRPLIRAERVQPASSGDPSQGPPSPTPPVTRPAAPAPDASGAGAPPPSGRPRRRTPLRAT